MLCFKLLNIIFLTDAKHAHHGAENQKTENYQVKKAYIQTFPIVSQLKRQAADRQRVLEEARRMQSFQQKSKVLKRWVGSVQERLLQEETATDVASAVALLDQHHMLRLEMEEQRSRYRLPTGFNVKITDIHCVCSILKEKKIFVHYIICYVSTYSNLVLEFNIIYWRTFVLFF